MASSKDCLINTICCSFKPEEVPHVKDMLWNKFVDYDILKEYIDRRDSPNRTEIMAMSEDIIDVLHDLEENEIDVICYAVNWHRVPKVKPEAMSDLSVAEKLAEIEAKFKLYDNSLSELKKSQSRLRIELPMWRMIVVCMATCYSSLHLVRPELEARRHSLVYNIPAFKLNRGNQASSISVASSYVKTTTGRLNVVNELKPNGRSRTSSAPDSSILLGGCTAHFLRTVHDIRRNERSSRNGTSHSGNNARRGVIMGQCAGTGLRAASLPNRDFFISRIHKDDGLEVMRQYIRSKGVVIKDFVQTSHVDSVFNPFILSVVITDVEKVRDPYMWPSYVFIRKWRD